MNIIDEIKKLEPQHIILSVSIFFAAVAPGFLIIQLYKPELLIKLGVLKLILFSLALTLPLIILNFSVSFSLNYTAIKSGEWSSRKDQLCLLLFADCLITAAIIYPLLLVAYTLHLRFMTLLVFIGIFELLTHVISGFIAHRLVKEK